MVVLSLSDGGESWKVDSYDVGFQQYEPATRLQEDRFLFVTRDQATGREHQQMAWSPGQTPTATRTDMKDPRYVDTVDFSFNPVTQRFEVIRSERYRMQLWLWSIAPKDWPTGEWRREFRLLARNGTFYSDADGFHPAGAVIDANRGVQPIFIYSGHPNGPAGVFRISRTLDTPKLSAFFGPTNDPARKDTNHWTGGGKPSRWNDPANWDLDVPDSKDVAVFEAISTGESVVIDQVADVGRIDLRLPDKSNRLLLAGSGTLSGPFHKFGNVFYQAAFW